MRKKFAIALTVILALIPIAYFTFNSTSTSASADTCADTLYCDCNEHDLEGIFCFLTIYRAVCGKIQVYVADIERNRIRVEDMYPSFPEHFIAKVHYTANDLLSRICLDTVLAPTYLDVQSLIDSLCPVALSKPEHADWLAWASGYTEPVLATRECTSYFLEVDCPTCGRTIPRSAWWDAMMARPTFVPTRSWLND